MSAQDQQASTRRDAMQAEEAARFRQRPIAIVGLGLMGGSLALALKAAGHTGALIGVSQRQSTLDLALAMGIISRGSSDLAAVGQADVVVLATPLRTLLRQIPAAAQAMRPGALLLDLGSAKEAVCAALAATPAMIEVVGGHPMCGKETSGLEAAEATLYHNKTFVLCPTPRSSRTALALALALIEAIGARPLILDPARHDRLAAVISHLPYMLSAALMQTAGAVSDTDPTLWQVAASGFRDTTRLAGSDPTMMADILLTNRAAVRLALTAYQAHLARLEALLQEADEAALLQALAAIQSQRLTLTAGRLPISTHLTPEAQGRPNERVSEGVSE